MHQEKSIEPAHEPTGQGYSQQENVCRLFHADLGTLFPASHQKLGCEEAYKFWLQGVT